MGSMMRAQEAAGAFVLVALGALPACATRAVTVTAPSGVTVTAPSGATARKAAALIDRLAAVGVQAEAGREVHGRVVVRLHDTRDSEALVRALLARDWWSLLLVEPEQRLVASPPPAGPFPDWNDWRELPARPVDAPPDPPKPLLTAPNRKRLVEEVRRQAGDRLVGID
jgi:hypothetical protein